MIFLLFVGAGSGPVFAEFGPMQSGNAVSPTGAATSDPASLSAQSGNPAPSVKPAQDAFRPLVDCTCRYRGQDYKIGDAVCIRGNLAVGETFLNNTSGSISKTPCPGVQLRLPE